MFTLMITMGAKWVHNATIFRCLIVTVVKFEIIGRTLYCAVRRVSNYIVVRALSYRREEVNYKCDLENLIRANRIYRSKRALAHRTIERY